MNMKVEYVTKPIYVAERKMNQRNLLFFYLVSFLQVFFGNLYSLSLFNELVFVRNLSYSIIGLSSSIYAFSYLLGPLLFRKPFEKVGIKRCLRVIVIAGSIYLLLLLIIVNPVILITINIIDGIFNAIFWSNITFAISTLQNGSSEESKKKAVRNYGLSWNFGAMAAEIVGFIIISLGVSDFHIRILSWFIGLVQIPLIMSLKIPNSKEIIERNCIENIKNNKIERKSSKKNPKASHLITYPVVFMLFGELIYQISRTLYGFIVPYVIISNPIASSIIYLTTFLQQVAQIGAIYLAARFNLNKKFRGFIVGIIGNIVISFLIGVSPTLPVLYIVMTSVGFLGGLIYIFSSQLLLEYSRIDKTMKYTSIYEIVSGFGFGITPLLMGIYVENYLIEIVRGFGMVLFVVLIVILNQQYKTQRDGEEIELTGEKYEELLGFLAITQHARVSALKFEPFCFTKIPFSKAFLPPSLEPQIQLKHPFS
jgi:MFS family permease